AGKTGIGSFDAAKEKGQGFWVIAADTDQSQLGAEYQLAVAEKGVDTAVFLGAQGVVKGTFKGGVESLGLKEGGVGLGHPAGVVANNGIDLSVRRGEIHALLGENGAGKTTLMNILFGLYHPDEGEIRVNGQPVRFGSARDAVLAGLAMVHQHFMLIPRFTVT